MQKPTAWAPPVIVMLRWFYLLRRFFYVETGAGTEKQRVPRKRNRHKTIVTNGDQTDTIYDGMDKQLIFEQSLRCREFEPDAPNYTPRISGIMHIEGGSYNYAMSILKSNNGDPSCCIRNTFAYQNPAAGEGRFIHTYMHDGNPLPSFEGEPKRVEISGNIDSFTDRIWNSLNADNKVSLFVRYINIEDGSYETRIVNKNK